MDAHTNAVAEAKAKEIPNIAPSNIKSPAANTGNKPNKDIAAKPPVLTAYQRMVNGRLARTGELPESTQASIAVGMGATIAERTVDLANDLGELGTDLLISGSLGDTRFATEANARNLNKISGVYTFLLHPIDNTIKFVKDYGNSVVDDFNATSLLIDEFEFFAAGKVIGNKVFDFGSTVVGVGGVAKVGAAAGKLASKVGKSTSVVPSAYNLRQRGIDGTLTPAYKLSTGSSAKLENYTNTTLTGKLTKSKLINYLENIHEIPRNNLIKDLESIGLKLKGNNPDRLWLEFTHKSKQVRVKIHAPDSVTNYSHIHIYNKNGYPLDANLNMVSNKSPDAHIKVSEFAKLIMENVPK